MELDEEQPGFVADVIESFFRNADESIARMREASSNGDLAALHAGAHMIRGRSQQLGVRGLGEPCIEIEQCQAVPPTSALVEKLEGDLEAARDVLMGLAERALDAAS